MPDKIMCLAGYTLNPGDFGWSPFERLGELVVYDRTPPDEIVPRAQGAPFVLTNKTPYGYQLQRPFPSPGGGWRCSLGVRSVAFSSASVSRL